MRLAFVTLCVLVFAAVAVSAVDGDMDEEAPVPTGFSLPNIFNPVLDRADGRDQAKTLVNLVAKEPKVAFGVGGPDAVIEDMWNGEKDPVSSASVAQLKMLKEVDSLTKLIDQGKKILKVLPRKEKRLSLLKRKLSKILDAKAKAEAEDKLDQQTALLNAIKKREGAMSKRLKALKNSQNKLQGSVKKLKKVIGGKKKGKKGKKGAKKGKKALPKVGLTKKSAGAASAKAAVRPSLLEADAEADIASEMESESEVEEENNQEQEMEFDAAEAFDQE
jgi:hypothetical protein